MTRRWIALLAAAVAMTTSGCAFVTRASVTNASPPDANGTSGNASFSGDARYLAFASSATNLTDSDTNGVDDIFVRDLQTNTNALASFEGSNLLGPANNTSANPSISGDGRFVAFESDATNLVANDTNGVRDVFVADLKTHTNDRVSVDNFEGQFNDESLTPSISDDGRYIAYTSFAPYSPLDSNGTSDIFVRDRLAGTTDYASISSTIITVGNDASFDPAISGNGTKVVFTSRASTLVNGDTNNATDVFMHDVNSGATTRVSVATGGAQLNGDSGFPAISSDGRYVAFASDASNAVAGDTNGTRDVFVRDTVAGTTQRISVSSSNAQATGGGSSTPTISGDGRFVGFESTASNLVANDTNFAQDIFVRDRVSNITLRASTTAQLAQANGPSQGAALSSDGRMIAFASLATNLDSNTPDGNGTQDVYARATRPPTVTSITPSTVTRGTSVPYTITGDGFLTAPNPMIFGPSGITFTVSTVTNTSITGTVSIGSSAPTGSQSFLVANPGTGAGQNAGAAGQCACLTVQ